MYVHLLILARCELRIVNCTTELLLASCHSRSRMCVQRIEHRYILTHARSNLRGGLLLSHPADQHSQRPAATPTAGRAGRHGVHGVSAAENAAVHSTASPPPQEQYGQHRRGRSPPPHLSCSCVSPGKQAGKGQCSTRTPRRQRAGQLGCARFPRWLRAGCARATGCSAGGTAWRGTARTQVGWGTADGRLRPAAARVPWRRDCPARLLSASALLSVLIF